MLDQLLIILRIILISIDNLIIKVEPLDKRQMDILLKKNNINW